MYKIKKCKEYIEKFSVWIAFFSALLLDLFILTLYYYFGKNGNVFDKLASGEILGGLLITLPTIVTWLKEAKRNRNAELMNNYRLRVDSFIKRYTDLVNSLEDKISSGERSNVVNHFVGNHKRYYPSTSPLNNIKVDMELQRYRIILEEMLVSEKNLIEERKENLVQVQLSKENDKDDKYDGLVNFVSLYLLLQTYTSEKINNNNEAKQWRRHIFSKILRKIKDEEESRNKQIVSDISSLYYSDKENIISCIDFSEQELTDELLALPSRNHSSVRFEYCYFTVDSIKKMISENESLMDTEEAIIMNNCEFEVINFKLLFTSNDEGVFPVIINSYYKDGVLTNNNFDSRGE